MPVGILRGLLLLPAPRAYMDIRQIELHNCCDGLIDGAALWLIAKQQELCKKAFIRVHVYSAMCLMVEWCLCI